jgi:hypothetical protein
VGHDRFTGLEHSLDTPIARKGEIAGVIVQDNGIEPVPGGYTADPVAYP